MWPESIKYVLSCIQISNCNENTASCHYLNAISYARSGEHNNAISNLSKAIKLNNSYKKEAAIDLEFLQLRSISAFVDLIN